MTEVIDGRVAAVHASAVEDTATLLTEIAPVSLVRAAIGPRVADYHLEEVPVVVLEVVEALSAIRSPTRPW